MKILRGVGERKVFVTIKAHFPANISLAILIRVPKIRPLQSPEGRPKKPIKFWQSKRIFSVPSEYRRDGLAEPSSPEIFQSTWSSGDEGGWNLPPLKTVFQENVFFSFRNNKLGLISNIPFILLRLTLLPNS